MLKQEVKVNIDKWTIQIGRHNREWDLADVTMWKGTREGMTAWSHCQK